MKKYVIVTGACGGIGRAAAEQLLADGFGVWAVDLSEDKLRETFGGMEDVELMPCDLSLEENIKTLVGDIVKKTGPVAGLLHCAGFDKLSPVYLNKRRDVEALFTIHVYAMMDLVKYISKKGNACEGCSIVLISSLSAHEGAAGHTAYAAAKGALEGFLPSAACELAERGIRINELVLGVVQTEMSNGYIGKMDEAQKTALAAGYPLGLGRPSDVSGMIGYLIGEKSGWVTGQRFVLDGGHSVRKV